MKKHLITLLFLFTQILFAQDFNNIMKAAEQGDAFAQYSLAYMYDNGEGTLKDLNKAFYWYSKAAEQGVANAQFDMAIIYYNGEGRLKDLKKSAYWTKKAFENGFEPAKGFWEQKELWRY